MISFYPLHKRLPPGLSLIDRFMDSFVVDKSGCWDWIRDIRKTGYGQININRKTQNAHRAMYEFFFGEITQGMHVDHLCRNRLCVNPSHMEVITPRDNALRGIGVTAKNAIKKSCLRGHPLSGNNLRLYTRKSSGLVRRICIECQRERVIAYRKRLRYASN